MMFDLSFGSIWSLPRARDIFLGNTPPVVQLQAGVPRKDRYHIYAQVFPCQRRAGLFSITHDLS